MGVWRQELILVEKSTESGSDYLHLISGSVTEELYDTGQFLQPLEYEFHIYGIVIIIVPTLQGCEDSQMSEV